jgi:NAD(P)-dependent dehydrogenase (short-subunit alcohol dehydrogenase family)
MTSGTYTGRTIAVVGASSGIGRGFSLRASRAGASVVMAARRADLLESLITEAGGGRAVCCDLAEPDAPALLADAIRTVDDHLDVLFVSAGAAPLRAMSLTDADAWRRALDVNVIGINRVVAGVLDLLRPESVVVLVSSETAVAPRSHLGAYGASKAALEHSADQWREEHPWLRLVTVSLGATVPTEFGRDFEHDELLEALEAWSVAGQNQSAFMDTDEVCDVLADLTGSLLRAGSVALPRIVLRAPAPGGANADAVVQLVSDSEKPDR